MWTNLLKQLPLSKTEQEVVRRLEDDPTGRGFLPAADVLRSHRMFDESIELLMQGVQLHPGFAVARVVLARELFQRGLIVDAWQYLEGSPAPIQDNVLAQKLRYKMAIILGDEGAAEQSYKNLLQQQGIDPEIKRLAQSVEVEGIVATRNSWRQELQSRGIVLKLPSTEEASAIGVRSSRHQEAPPEAKARRGARFILEYELDETIRKEISGFHVIPLSEVLSPGQNVGAVHQGPPPVELDSTTLAEIYARQGHYARSLGIYRRLLRLSPHNDLLRMKVTEMARLEREQRDDDIQVDPVIFDRMETVEIIDRQMRVYDEILEKLK